ncbi:MAG: RagB/SusD family nutrient uptake outer membrane protein [Bacteroidetes bacterium]|nr:RagB/SusD family nutrient uptake outer membrane protein [Bacteroidota bacterium]
MQLSKITIIALFLITLSGVSCKKILDLEPHNSTFTEAFFKTGTDANSAISGAYALLRQVLMNNYSWHVYGDLPSGEYEVNGGLDAFNQPICSGQFIGLNVGSWEWNWQNYYQLIQQINLVITKVPDIPLSSFTNPDLKKQIIGEAYFLRAYTYFYMTRIWGDVPLKLAPDLDVSQAINIPRTPAATVWAQCLADCQTAEGNLTFGYADQTQAVVRANKGSVLALKAHIQAWKKDYAACEKTADTLISQGGYTLVDSAHYNEVFVGRSTEGIFEVNINYGQSEGVGLNNDDGSGDGGYLPTLARPFIQNQVNVNWPISNPYVNRIFRDTADIRYYKFFYQAYSNNGQTIKYSNITYADGSAHNDPRLSNNLNIFRLPDIMLLRAEALNKLGRDADALPLLNAVKTRAGIVPYSGAGGDDLATEILEERLRELFFEGQAYYDLIRTGKILDYNENFNASQYQNGGWMWPIDPSMFKDDFTLVQTPYWRGKL